MAAVAERRGLRLLAAAKVHGFRGFGLERLRALIGAGVRAIAKGLSLRPPASAPEVGFACLGLDRVWFLLCDKAVV